MAVSGFHLVLVAQAFLPVRLPVHRQECLCHRRHRTGDPCRFARADCETGAVMSPIPLPFTSARLTFDRRADPPSSVPRWVRLLAPSPLRRRPVVCSPAGSCGSARVGRTRPGALGRRGLVRRGARRVLRRTRPSPAWSGSRSPAGCSSPSTAPTACGSPTRTARRGQAPLARALRLAPTCPPAELAALIEQAAVG